MSKPSNSEIKQWLVEDGHLNNPEVSFLAEGFGNYNFLAIEADKKYVVRVKKSTEVQFKDSLEREYVFLSYVYEQGIRFCPKPIYYDKERDYFIQEFLDGVTVFQNNFTDDQIDLFAKQLNELFELPVDKFYDFCEEKGVRQFKALTAKEDIQKYGINRFKLCDGQIVGKDVMTWIEINLQENINYILSKPEPKLEDKGFSWGDVQSHVIINKEQEMFFYDFEHVQIRSVQDLLYIKIHGKFSKEQYNLLVDSYAKYSGHTTSTLIEIMNKEERIIRVNDVIWAAMKWTQEGDKFSELTEKRIRLADDIK